MTDTAHAPPLICPKAVSDALAALGAYAQPPTEGAAGGRRARGGPDRVGGPASNALYASALAHVMTAELAVAQAGSDTGYHHEAWRAAGADGEGIMILLHYTALRLAAELRAVAERLDSEYR